MYSNRNLDPREVAVGTEWVFLIAANLEHLLMPNYGAGLPPALWVCRYGVEPRLFWRLTPLVYVRILEQLATLEEKWTPDDEALSLHLAQAAELMEPVFRWATEHFTEEDMKAARASTAPMPRMPIPKEVAQAIDDPAFGIAIGPRFEAFAEDVERHNRAAAERWYRRRHQETEAWRQRRQLKKAAAAKAANRREKKAAVGTGGMFSAN